MKLTASRLSLHRNYRLHCARCAVMCALAGMSPVFAFDSAELDCVIEASEVADISSSVQGIMSVVKVKRGQWVEQGEIVADLESSVEEGTVALARARAEAVHLIRARRAHLALATKRANRAADLRKSHAIAPQELDEVETEKVLAQIELEQAREERRIAGLELARAEKMLALRTIRSPVSGVVVEIYTSAGESVEDRPIMRVAQIDPLHVEAVAPVTLFGSIAEGAVSTVLPEEPIGGQFTATVSTVERIIDAPSGTFGVRLILPNPEKTLPAGLRCKLRLAEQVAN